MVIDYSEGNCGRTLFCFNTSLLLMLIAWQEKNKNYKEWDDIYFSKLALILHLMLEKLYRESYKKSVQYIDGYSFINEDEVLISFKSPYKFHNGLHGPGPALLITSKPTTQYDFIQFVLNKLNDFFQNDIHYPVGCLFKVDPIIKNKKYKINKKRDRSVRPMASLGKYEPAFKSKDFEIIDIISNIFAQFDKEEIRAFGTHQSKKQTLEAIETLVYKKLPESLIYNIIKLCNRDISYALSRWFKSIPKKDKPPFPDTIIEEINLKTDTNREYYQNAFEKIERKKIEFMTIEKQENNNEEIIFDIIRLIYSAPNEIWGSDEIKKWNEHKYKLNILTKLVDKIIKYYSLLLAKNKQAIFDYNDKLNDISIEYEELAIEYERLCNYKTPPLEEHLENFDWGKLIECIFILFNTLPHYSHPNIFRYYKNFEADLRK